MMTIVLLSLSCSVVMTGRQIAEHIVFLTSRHIALNTKSLKCCILLTWGWLGRSRARAWLCAVETLEIILELLLQWHVVCGSP